MTGGYLSAAVAAPEPDPPLARGGRRGGVALVIGGYLSPAIVDSEGGPSLARVGRGGGAASVSYEIPW